MVFFGVGAVAVGFGFTLLIVSTAPTKPARTAGDIAVAGAASILIGIVLALLGVGTELL